MILTDENYIRSVISRRDPDSHKGNFGKVLIYAGSLGMAGAAVLCARAALKSGAGLVQFLLPDFSSALLPILQISVPEATCVDYSKGLQLGGYDAVAAGSGLGTDPDPVKLSILSDILDHYAGPLVLDADALNITASNEEIADKVRSFRAQVIITPHIGEAKRLLHSSSAIAGEESRIRAAKMLSETCRCIAVLKGSGTLVTDGGAVYRNTTGNPGMAAAGSGDCLTGLIASLCAQGYAPLDAARTGVFIHGKAGDLASALLGEMGMTSSDIADQIPKALNLYYGN